MSDAILLGIIAVLAIVASLAITSPKRQIPKIQVGNVMLTGNAIEYVIGRMRDRIIQLTDENEQLRREVRLEKTIRIQ